jgi:hypothetical protein
VWVKLTAIPVPFAYIVAKGNFLCDRASYALYFTNDGLQFYIGNNATIVKSPPWTSFVVNRLYNIVGTFDGSSVKLYVNGALIGGTPTTQSIGYDTTTDLLTVGYFDCTGTPILPLSNAALANLCFFDEALSAEMVQDLYETCSPPFCVGSPLVPPVIDGTITDGEWTGAETATIGNGGGIAYLKADANFIYGAFNITGWTVAMGANSQGNLLGFGVWNADNSAPPRPNANGVEFQQATAPANWGGGGPSGTLNGLPSAFRINGVIQTSIPTNLEAKDSFATGHRVWEVKMPISTMTVIDCQVWVVGGINYDGQQHWYPDTFFPSFAGYKPVTLQGPPS